jgi:hypothetical protein
MPRAGLEPTILVFELLKTVRALDRTVTGTGTINSKSKFVPVRNHVPRHKDVWQSEGKAPCILNLVELSGHLHDLAVLPLLESTTGTHWIGWVGPRAGPNTVAKRKIVARSKVCGSCFGQSFCFGLSSQLTGCDSVERPALIDLRIISLYSYEHSFT